MKSGSQPRPAAWCRSPCSMANRWATLDPGRYGGACMGSSRPIGPIERASVAQVTCGNTGLDGDTKDQPVPDEQPGTAAFASCIAAENADLGPANPAGHMHAGQSNETDINPLQLRKRGRRLPRL